MEEKSRGGVFAQSCLALESVAIMVSAFHAAELLEGRKTLIYRAFTISVEVVEIYTRQLVGIIPLHP